MIPITKHVDLNTKQPKVFLCYDFANDITNEEEEILLQAKLELFTIGTIILLKSGTLVFYVVPKTSSEELQFDFFHTPREILIDEVPTHLKVQDLKIARWTLQKDVQIRDSNLGIAIEPMLVKLNTDLDLSIAAKIKSLLQEYKDVFPWTWKDFKGIPSPIAQHQIELNIMILPSHQNWYRMNPNYVVVVKQDLDKLLIARFITSVEEAI